MNKLVSEIVNTLLSSSNSNIKIDYFGSHVNISAYNNIITINNCIEPSAQIPVEVPPPAEIPVEVPPPAEIPVEVPPPVEIPAEVPPPVEIPAEVPPPAIESETTSTVNKRFSLELASVHVTPPAEKSYQLLVVPFNEDAGLYREPGNDFIVRRGDEEGVVEVIGSIGIFTDQVRSLTLKERIKASEMGLVVI